MTLRKKVAGLRAKFSSKRTLALLLIVLLLAGGITLATPRIKSYLKSQQQKQVERDRVKNLSAVDLQSEIDKAIASNDLATAEKIIKQHHDYQSKDNLIMLSMIYLGQGKHDSALATLESAEQRHGLDAGLAQNIARTKLLLEDKDGAIDYYQKAIDLLKQENAEANAEAIKELEDVITELQQ